MIFHVPFRLEPNSAFANDIRPIKMLEAFRAIGYEVDVIQGDGRERKAAVSVVRRHIDEGTTYSFVYSECGSLPTSLTGSSKRPRHPFFDLAFLWRCRRKGIPVGLFYRDVYWRFPESGQYRSEARRLILSGFYLFDLIMYNVAVSKLYLPSVEMLEFVPFVSRLRVGSLPPGHDVHKLFAPRLSSVNLRLVFVGGLGANYDLRSFMRVVRGCANVSFTLCTRVGDWERNRSDYADLMGANMEVIHEKGEGLRRVYAEADIGIFWVKPTRYLEFASPVKIYEYLGYGLPIIASANTHAGDFVTSNGVGWNVEFREAPLKALLMRLSNDPTELEALRSKISVAREESTWTARARAVAGDLC